MFNPKYRFRLTSKQIINHFPNHYELTRKDLLVKNLKRFKPIPKSITLATGEIVDLSNHYIPTTFILPSEYSIFLEEFAKSTTKNWIFKPAGKSQGKGIQLITKFSQAKSLHLMMNQFRNRNNVREKFIISKYIDNPLLLEGKKFDLRTYVCVTNYKPLKVWKYREGFARVCFEEYT